MSIVKGLVGLTLGTIIFPFWAAYRLIRYGKVTW